MEPTYQFWYFPLLSNGELARLTLALAGAEWENKFPDWKAEMDSTPFGQLPVLVINENGKETHLAQPQVIVRYLAARYNLVLQATCTARLVEAVNDTMFDYKQKLSPITWTLKGEELDNAKKELQDTTAPALTKYLLQHIGSYDTFVGDKIDVFELSLYYLMSLTPEGVPGSFTHENASELFKVYFHVQNNGALRLTSTAVSAFRVSFPEPALFFVLNRRRTHPTIPGEASLV